MPSPTDSSDYSSVADTGYVTIDALAGSTKWGGGAGSGVSLTYSFPSGTAYTDPFYSQAAEWSHWRALNSTQMIQARAALQVWANVANVSFFETSESNTNVGDIRFATFSGGRAKRRTLIALGARQPRGTCGSTTTTRRTPARRREPTAT